MTARSPWLAPAATPIPLWWAAIFPRLWFAAVSLCSTRLGRVLYLTATNLAFVRSRSLGYDTALTQGGDELDLLRRLQARGKIIWDPANPVFTSSRRMNQGLPHTLVVSFGYHYAGSYLVNRLTSRTVLGAAPAIRGPRRRGGPMPQAALARGCRDGHGHDCGPGASRFRALTWSCNFRPRHVPLLAAEHADLRPCWSDAHDRSRPRSPRSSGQRPDRSEIPIGGRISWPHLPAAARSGRLRRCESGRVAAGSGAPQRHRGRSLRHSRHVRTTAPGLHEALSAALSADRYDGLVCECAFLGVLPTLLTVPA